MVKGQVLQSYIFLFLLQPAAHGCIVHAEVFGNFMEAGLGVFSRSFRPPEDSCVLDSTPNRFARRRTRASKFWECYVGT